MKIEPRRLLELLAVARHGSISGAAEAVNMSQPALSQSIALLEREVGVKVLERGRQGARLNDFGDALVFYAQALESLLGRAGEEIRMRSLGLEGTLAIGITPVSAVQLVPRCIEALLRESPNIGISIVDGLDHEITEMLRTRQLDLLVRRLGIATHFPDIEEEALFEVDWSLITAPDHPLASRGTVRLSDLKDVQWVLPAGGSAFRQQMEQVFMSSGFDWPDRGISTNSILAIKSMVMRAGCVSIISPRLVEVEAAAGRLRVIPLEGLGPLRPVGLIWRRGEKLSPIAARFAKILRTLAQEETDIRASDLAAP
ncbi:LysR family transcriptional regulator [Rhodoplanes sp. TEM]|uniref:LysR family transcriptional regulator n=1 Tax=Rhodoplanes tepidamans TaxID=200616 RepID=A0ABT5J472_RHOTP|nr:MULTISPECIES: LysR family transcriptional regulator [Rhodoplanes]MDC7784221.1 LysR family transcriptional regulator [Rhodoplanes tepidamans]MDC7987361.1 LysR family transcriptional regulator [Rhodoplanes sp. TEM]MDQ0356681.1 DNA-binding transcriptional LysR family regulator [Rhodoplanes tepidamans]